MTLGSREPRGVNENGSVEAAVGFSSSASSAYVAE